MRDLHSAESGDAQANYRRYNLLLIQKNSGPPIILFNEVGNYGNQNEFMSLNSLLNWQEMFFKTDFQSWYMV